MEIKQLSDQKETLPRCTQPVSAGARHKQPRTDPDNSEIHINTVFPSSAATLTESEPFRTTPNHQKILFLADRFLDQINDRNCKTLFRAFPLAALSRQTHGIKPNQPESR